MRFIRAQTVTNRLTLATLFSLGLHAVFVLWTGALPTRGQRTSAAAPPVLQVTLLQPAPRREDVSPKRATPEPAPEPKKPRLGARAPLSKAASASPQLTDPATNPSNDAQAIQATSPAKAESTAAPRTVGESATASPAAPSIERPWRMQMESATRQGIGRGAEMGLATRAQEQINGSNGRISAIEKSFNQALAGTQQTGSIVAETTLADGSRLIKFSAGSCMRIPNPSLATPATPAQAMVTNCP